MDSFCLNLALVFGHLSFWDNSGFLTALVLEQLLLLDRSLFWITLDLEQLSFWYNSSFGQLSFHVQLSF